MALIDGKVRAALVEAIGGAVVPRDALRERLRVLGFSAEQVDRQLQFDASFTQLRDGFAHIPSLTEGVAFALFVDPDDAAEGFVRMHPVLDPIGWWIVSGPVPLRDAHGAEAGAFESDSLLLDGVDSDVVLGPHEWLDRHAGTWVALRVRDGALVTERLEGPPPAEPAVAAAIAATFDAFADHHPYQAYGTDEVVDVERENFSELVLEAIAGNRSLLAGDPLAHPADLLAAAELRLHDTAVIRADVDLEVFAGAEAERRAMARWGVDADTVLGAQMVLGAMRMHAEGDADAFGATPEERELAPVLFAALLERGDVARIVGYEVVERGVCDSAVEFAEVIGAAFEREDMIWGARWLAAHALLSLGRVDEAAAILDGIADSVESLPLLVDRARVAADRSQAQIAHRLVLRGEVLTEDLDEFSPVTYAYRQVLRELHDEVEPWASNPPPPTARRNDRCPCGSGRKYKVCHLGRELHPIAERAAWLYDKMTRFVHDQVPDEIDTLASVFADAMDAPDQWAALADTPFLSDVVLHEVGLAQRFVEGRLATLPDDEVLLAGQWMLVDRSVFEVDTADPGRLDLRDLATGERAKVTNIGPGRTAKPAAIMLGRPLPVGDTYRAFSGFLEVRPDLVTDALELVEAGDPDELVSFLGAMHRPPLIQNTDGHDMVLTDLRWSLPAGADAAKALVDAGFGASGQGWTLVRDTTNQRDSVIASVEVTGGTLEAHVNSAERSEELRALIARHLPDAVLVDTVVHDLDDIDLTVTPGPVDPEGLLDDPEVRAALESHFAAYEQEWLDTPIPALGDRTPRQAAADPIGREQLIRLLATFPEPAPGALGMSAVRLRAALEL